MPYIETKPATLEQFHAFCAEKKLVDPEYGLSRKETVEQRIILARKEDPKITWPKLYRTISHHYKSFGSFYRSMKRVW